MTQNTVGVDVSKDHLDAHRLADGGWRRWRALRRMRPDPLFAQLPDKASGAIGLVRAQRRAWLYTSAQ